MKQILKDQDAINPLKNLARVRDPEIKREAIEALAELGISYVAKGVKKTKDGEPEKAQREVVERERTEVEARERTQREALERESIQRDVMEREARERAERQAVEKEVLERESAERARLEREAMERAMREAAERDASEKILIEKQKMDRERLDSEARSRAEREALEAQAREAREALSRAQEEKYRLERERGEREALEREVQAARRALEQARAEREALEREARLAFEQEALELARQRDEMERALNDQSYAGPLRLVTMTEVVEVDDEKDIDEDYEEEDDEITEDDKREKAKIALVMVDLWEPAEDRTITESALRKLASLSLKERNRKLIRIAGAVPILVELIKPSDPSTGLTPIESLALASLAILVRNVRNREEVRRNEGLRHHLRLMKTKEEKDLVENMKALKELAKDDRNKALLREGHLIEILIPKIVEKNPPIQEHSLDILTIMSLNDGILS